MLLVLALLAGWPCAGLAQGQGAIALFDTESAYVEKRTLKLAATSFISRWVAAD